MARGCVVDVSRGGDTCESVAWKTGVMLPRREEDVELQRTMALGWPTHTQIIAEYAGAQTTAASQRRPGWL